MSLPHRFRLGRTGGGAVAESGEYLYSTPGSYTFTVPDGVTSLSVVAVGGGGGGDWDHDGKGGGGGGLAYLNSYAVSPGQTYSVTVGAGADPLPSNFYGNNGGNSQFGGIMTATGGSGGNQCYNAEGNAYALGGSYTGTYTGGGTGGGIYGTGGTRVGGGGAAGWSGQSGGFGGHAIYTMTYGTGGTNGGGGGGRAQNGTIGGSGGGVGIINPSSTSGAVGTAFCGYWGGGGGGSGGQPGGGGTSTNYGGDYGGGATGGQTGNGVGYGGKGAVRIIWGNGATVRSFPYTNTQQAYSATINGSPNGSYNGL